jgi:hypothetical protein
MSTETAPPRRALIATSIAEQAQRRLALRLALGVSLAFAAAQAFGWSPSMLVPVFVIQLLVSVPHYLSLRAGLSVVVSIGVACGATLLIVYTLLPFSDLYIAAIALLLFMGFLIDARGRSPFFAFIFLVAVAVLPVIAVDSVEAASALAWALTWAGGGAVVIVWIAHALFPAPVSAVRLDTHRPDPRPTDQQRQAGSAARVALLKTLIVLPVVIVFLFYDLASALVVLVITITIVRQQDVGKGSKSAFALLLGNIMGGIAATMAYGLLKAYPTLLFLFLLTVLIGLWFGGRIALGGSRAPLFVVGFTTMVILLASGISPTGDEAAEAFYTRLINVFIATVYAVAMLSILFPQTAERGAPAQGSIRR